MRVVGTRGVDERQELWEDFLKRVAAALRGHRQSDDRRAPPSRLLSVPRVGVRAFEDMRRGVLGGQVGGEEVYGLARALFEGLVVVVVALARGARLGAARKELLHDARGELLSHDELLAVLEGGHDHVQRGESRVFLHAARREDVEREGEQRREVRLEQRVRRRLEHLLEQLEGAYEGLLIKTLGRGPAHIVEGGEERRELAEGLVADEDERPRAHSLERRAPHVRAALVGEQRLQRRRDVRKVRTQRGLDDVLGLEERREQVHRELAMLRRR